MSNIPLYGAELVGTFLLVLLGNAVVGNVVLKGTKGNGGGWIVITAGWGLAVFVGAFVVFSTSGAHLNPAVSIGLASGGIFDWALVPGYITGQMLGGLLGALFVWLLFIPHWPKTDDPDLKLACFATIPAIESVPNNLFSEFLGTFVLIFGILCIKPAYLNLHETTAVIDLGAEGLIPVSLLVMAIGLSLGGTTGYAINPARDLSPRFMHWILPIPGKGSSQWRYASIPVVGPILGSVAAAGLYVLLIRLDVLTGN